MLLFPSPSSSSSSTTATATANATATATATTSLFTPSLNLNSPKYPSKTRLSPLKSLPSPPSNLTANVITSTQTEVQNFRVRRPVIKPDGRDGNVEMSNGGDEGSSSSGSDDDDAEKEESVLDKSLEKLAKKLPMFEPGKGEAEEGGGVIDQPLKVNLDLALYRAKIFTRNFEFHQAQELLQQCINYWPEDGRPYVALGKVLRKQSRVDEARDVYEKGSQATQGENAYVWQCWAVLENELGNVRKARELFDASTVADKRHIAAWHGWAVLELKQGNIQKARNLLGKGIKYCGGNEYVYQTLALLEAKANRYEQARYLFRQATKCNPKSCASWLAWAQLEMQKENNRAARSLFEAWGWMEWKEGNLSTARELYQKALSIDATSESAARCLQAWGVLEQRVGNMSAARRLFRSSLNINSQSYVTWMTWANLEQDQGNSARAEEIRDLYFQQRIEVVDDASWVTGFLDILDPALDSIKRLLNFEQDPLKKTTDSSEAKDNDNEVTSTEVEDTTSGAGFDLDAFVKEKLSLDTSNLDDQLETSLTSIERTKDQRKVSRSRQKYQ